MFTAPSECPSANSSGVRTSIIIGAFAGAGVSWGEAFVEVSGATEALLAVVGASPAPEHVLKVKRAATTKVRQRPEVAMDSSSIRSRASPFYSIHSLRQSL